jgi:drug/metabolite transporter (DMT)-like permease
VWLFLGERPSAATLVGGVIVLGAVLLEARPDRGPPPSPV